MLLWTWNQWHRLHIAHVQLQFHPRWNLTAANTPNTLWIKTRTDTSCMRLWFHRPTAVGAFQDYLKNIYFRGRGGAGLFFLYWKQKCVSCYLRSRAWTLKSLHDICSPCHHIERQPYGIDHNKSTTEWNEWCEAIQPMAAQQRFQLLAKLNPGPKLVEREATCNHRCSSFWEYNFWF